MPLRRVNMITAAELGLVIAFLLPELTYAVFGHLPTFRHKLLAMHALIAGAYLVTYLEALRRRRARARAIAAGTGLPTTIPDLAGMFIDKPSNLISGFMPFLRWYSVAESAHNAAFLRALVPLVNAADQPAFRGIQRTFQAAAADRVALEFSFKTYRSLHRTLYEILRRTQTNARRSKHTPLGLPGMCRYARR